MAKEKKNWVIRCGCDTEAYMTKIIPEQLGHTPIYEYGTSDKKKALRFTKAEAEELARKRQARAVELKTE